MDTTSHEFTWQTFTFGDIGNSVLFDVAVISENNIWCVGEIRIADNSPSGYTTYNAVHWDGNEWKLHRVMFYTFCPDGIGSGSYPARAVFAIDSETIIIASGSQVAYLKNGIQIKRECIPATVNKIWGTSSSDVFVVGNNGNIAHYNGSQWKKIESGTNVDLKDVWGSPDGKVVWACGETIYKTVLVKIENNTASIVFEGTYPMPTIKNKFSDGLLSVWTNSNKFIYVLSPYNLYRCKVTTTGEGEELYPYSDYFKGAYLRLRGTAINNLFTSGNKSTITHFNGISWEIYDELRNEDQRLRGLDVRENIMVTVGEKYENTFYYKAIIIVGKR